MQLNNCRQRTPAKTESAFKEDQGQNFIPQVKSSFETFLGMVNKTPCISAQRIF